MAIKVSLRKKKITDGRHSLYLDFYPHVINPETGQPTRREFLKMYVIDKAKDLLDKQHNSNTLATAEQIRQRRESELSKPEIYNEVEKETLRVKALGERDFVAYFKGLADERKASNHDNWVSAYKYLDAFTGGSLKVADLNERFCNDFKKYLLTSKSNRSNKVTLSQNSAVSYFNKVKAALKQAYKDGLILTNLNAKVEPIKQAETHREFLNLNELNTLIKTECNNPLLKRAALFSALTGLRFSDIQKLVWGEVCIDNENGHYIQFTQKKTKGTEVMPISAQAYRLLGSPQQPTDKVFEGLTYSAYQNKHLFQWIGAAGITKDITFHCFRHTFATMQLTEGTDIYTVSKMLGHRELKTTQLYAKVIDPTKRKAADAIKVEGI